MSWAARRRFVILSILGSVGAAVLAVTLLATFYETPSCSDGKQNQNESGIDCGSPCAYLCSADLEAPVVLYTKALSNTNGRTDVLASVENKNKVAAAKAVPYKIKLYSSEVTLIAEKNGTVDLPPGTKVLVFTPGVASGKQQSATAFLTIEPDAPKWFESNSSPALPSVKETKISGTEINPRVEAVLENGEPYDMRDVRVIAVLRGEEEAILGASSTIVPLIRAGRQATVVFTWTSAFPGIPLSIEIIPRISL